MVALRADAGLSKTFSEQMDLFTAVGVRMVVGSSPASNPPRVDRSAACVYRQMDMSVVNSGLSMIGVAKSLSLFVDTGLQHASADINKSVVNSGLSTIGVAKSLSLFVETGLQLTSADSGTSLL